LTGPIPEDLAGAINQRVTAHLAAELGRRGLLLRAADFRHAGQRAAQLGAGLLEPVIHQCYPLSQYDSQTVSVEFDDDGEAARVCAALAFGATTADLLASADDASATSAGALELLSATLNLGVGLIDGVCDDDGPLGLRLLALIEAGDMSAAVRQPRPRGWLRAQLPAALESHAAASFAVDIVETFLALLHATFPGNRWTRLRGTVGTELRAALTAERCSLTAKPADTPRRMLESHSRTTSVLPFEIVGTLVHGGRDTSWPSAATLLGEAMWRIDDLVDLCDDTQTGALNAVLLAATAPHGVATGQHHRLAALESLLESRLIPDTAAQAAETLLRAITLANHGSPNTDEQRLFLHFTQRYAGVDPPT
jgi:hypothetical protein